MQTVQQTAAKALEAINSLMGEVGKKTPVQDWGLINEACLELRVLQAAREQGGGEAVAQVVSGYSGDPDTLNNKALKALDLSECTIGQKLYTHPSQSQGVPEGYVLAPKSMCITQDDVGLIVMMTGWDDEDQDDAEGVLWFGLIEDDEGNRTHGLNISCSECMEEGAIQLVQFDEPNSAPAAPQADEIDLRERLRDALTDALGEALDCTRVWSAWGVGTMSQNDFAPIADDAERIEGLVEAALSAIQRPQPPEQEGE